MSIWSYTDMDIDIILAVGIDAGHLEPSPAVQRQVQFSELRAFAGEGRSLGYEVCLRMGAQRANDNVI